MQKSLPGTPQPKTCPLLARYPFLLETIWINHFHDNYGTKNYSEMLVMHWICQE